MRPKAYRIFLRAGTPWTFTLTWSVGFMAFLFALAFVTTPDSSRIAAVYPMLLLGLMAYVLDRGTRSWIRISDDGREAMVVPSWFSRKLLGRRRIVVALPVGSELLFCRRIRFCIIARTPDGTEHLLLEEEDGMSRRRCEQIATDLKQRFNLDVRLLKQTVPGRDPETEWTPQLDRNISRTLWRNLRMSIGIGLAPWLGIVVRMLTANPRTIALAGFLLWALGGAWIWSSTAHSRRPQDAASAERSCCGAFCSF